MTVAEALTALAPARRSAIVAARAGARRRAGRRRALAASGCPAWARATVDGYAVRAADTYAAAETLPAFLELTGAVTMGRAPGRARSARAPRWRSRPAGCSRTAPTPS